MIERLDGFTADGKGNVIPGDPQDGDVIRIDGKIEQRYFTPVPITPPEFKTLSGSEFIALAGGALGFPRVDQLLAKSLSIQTLLVKADKVDRNTGNTPAAIAFLMTGTNALTQMELDTIDTAWRALTS